jgi:hypothetical protein
MKKITACILLAAAAAFCATTGSLRAGTLTLDDGSPSFVPPEAFTNNSLSVDTTIGDPGLIHISGFTTVTPPSDQMATIAVSGTFSADAGDKFSVAYRFSTDLNADGPITYTLSGSINGVPIPDSTGTIEPGVHIYQGTAESPTFPFPIAGNFSGTLTLDFANQGGAAFPGTLDLSVQQLDFQLSPTAVTIMEPSVALNISTRANVGTGEDVLIGGFIVTGTEDKQVVLRGLGPSIVGVNDSLLQDPMIELHDQSGAVIDSNDNWMDLSDANKTVLSDNMLEPTNDAESALVETLAPGEYTVVLSGVGDTTGVGLVEIYGLQDGTNSVLANISSRATVDAGDNVMIAGFILGAGGGGFSQVVVRGIGPSLTDSGIDNPLADPLVEIFNENGDSLVSNDNWMDDPNMQQVQDLGLAPTDPNESAIYDVLPAGSYTAVLSSADQAATAGVGVIETYEVDNQPTAP